MADNASLIKTWDNTTTTTVNEATIIMILLVKNKFKLILIALIVYLTM